MCAKAVKSDTAKDVGTTGHVWDGIEELNNPLPRWWVWVFYLTIIWAVGYAIAYPAFAEHRHVEMFLQPARPRPPHAEIAIAPGFQRQRQDDQDADQHQGQR